MGIRTLNYSHSFKKIYTKENKYYLLTYYIDFYTVHINLISFSLNILRQKRVKLKFMCQSHLVYSMRRHGHIKREQNKWQYGLKYTAG